VPFTIPILGHTFNYLFNPKNFIKQYKEQVTNNLYKQLVSINIHTHSFVSMEDVFLFMYSEE
jgi:hypothetical protein